MSLQDIIRNMDRMEIEVRNKMDNRLRNAGGFLLECVKANASLTDHSYYDLAMLGHPYSKGKPPDTLHGSDAILHIQSGELYNHIKMWEHKNADTSLVEVGVDKAECPKIEDIYENEVTRTRPFIEKALEMNVNEIKLYLDGE